MSKNNQPIPVRFAASAPTLQVDTQIDMPVDMPVDTQFQTQQPIEVSPSSNDSSKIEIFLQHLISVLAPKIKNKCFKC